MTLFSRINKGAFRVFLRTAGWLALFSLFPAVIYAITDSAWMGVKVFLLLAGVSTLGLLWAFWGSLFSKNPGGS